MASMVLMVSLSIFQLTFQNVPILSHMVGGSWFQKRLCLVAARVMPVAFCVLIHPRRRPSASAFGVNARAKFNVRRRLNICPNIYRRFIFVHNMSNAIPKIARIWYLQFFRISLCHQPDLFKAPQQCRFDLSRNLRAVVLNINVHCCPLPNFSSSLAVQSISSLSLSLSTKKYVPLVFLMSTTMPVSPVLFTLTRSYSRIILHPPCFS
nr:MAG TPA: hypothetical protein [Caudoviricetes sp.]